MIRPPPTSPLFPYTTLFRSGPDYTKGACPGCTSLGDGLDGSLVHLNHRDVTLICFSRAPIERLTAYKQRIDRKSTRLNSSHPSISYAVFCLKKKKYKILPSI